MEYLSVCTKKIQKPRSYLTVEPALFLFMFASFLSYPVYQELLHHTFCQQDPSCRPPPPHTRNQSSCSSESYPASVRNKTSHWILYTNLSLGITSLILSLLYGSLSDATKERRVFLILPSVGATINALLIVVVQYTSPDYTWVYLVGAGLSGLTGGVSVFNLSAYSYAADISNHGDRTQRMGWLEATMYTSSFLSQLIGGVWIDKQGYATPYFGVIACHVTVVFYVLLFLPAQEENGEEQPRPLGDVEPLLVNATVNKPPKRKKVVEIFLRVYRFIHLLCHSWQHLCLAVVFLILELNFLGIIDTVILYALSRLCWDSKTIGYFLAEKSGFNAIAALLVLPLLVRFRVSDPVIGIIGLLFGSAALVVMGFATQTWIMFIVPVIGAMRGCVVPVVRSMVSKITPSDQQGIVFSGLSIIEASCIIFSSSLYNSLFPLTYSVHPGFCFFMMALCLLMIIPLMLFLYCDTKLNSKSNKEDRH